MAAKKQSKPKEEEGQEDEEQEETPPTPPKPARPPETPVNDVLAGVSKQLGEIHAKVFPPPPKKEEPKAKEQPASSGVGVLLIGLLLFLLPFGVLAALYNVGVNRKKSKV